MRFAVSIGSVISDPKTGTVAVAVTTVRIEKDRTTPRRGSPATAMGQAVVTRR